jgi:hypothetical protein
MKWDLSTGGFSELEFGNLSFLHYDVYSYPYPDLIIELLQKRFPQCDLHYITGEISSFYSPYSPPLSSLTLTPLTLTPSHPYTPLTSHPLTPHPHPLTHTLTLSHLSPLSLFPPSHLSLAPLPLASLPLPPLRPPSHTPLTSLSHPSQMCCGKKPQLRY